MQGDAHPTTELPAGSPVERVRAEYLSAVLRGNRRDAVRIVTEDAFHAGLSVADIQFGVVQEAQREIGRLWQENVISIAQEHLATAISQVVLARLYDHAPFVNRNGRKVLLACVEGELHDFPARLAADALDLSGFDTLFLGANVPTESLVKMVRDNQVDMVALSVTMAFNIPALRSAVAAVRSATDGRLPIAVGGAGCAWAEGLAEELGVELTGTSAASLVEHASRLLGVAP